MKGAKILIFIACALFITSAASVGYVIYSQYRYTNYEVRLTKVIAEGLRDGTGYAEYNGVKTRLNNANLEMLQTVLGIGERRTADKTSDAEKAAGIRLDIGENSVIYAVELGGSDECNIYTTLDGTRYDFKLIKYRAFERLLEYIGEQGKYGSNLLMN